MECSFLNLSSGSCSGIFKPVVAYEDNKIDNEHDITSLAEVLKYRGLFFEENKKNLIICETHVTEFGKRWRASEFCSLRYRCKNGRALPRGKINVIQSRYLLEQEGLAVPFGSGTCSKCKTELLERMKLFYDKKRPDQHIDEYLQFPAEVISDQRLNENHQLPPEATAFVLQDHAYCCIEESHSPVDVLEVAPLPVDVLEVCVEDNMTVDMTANDNKESEECQGAYRRDFYETLSQSQESEECQSVNQSDFFETSSQSQEFSQSSDSDWQASQPSLSPTARKRTALNNFLDQIGVSPLKKTLRVDWSAASDRTKADHLRKAQQTIKGVLALIAPNQEETLQEQLFPSKNANLLESVASSYESMTSWGAQRQILSLLVQDYNYAELKTHIPSLSRYKFSAARKHGIRVGQGMPVGDFHGPKVKVKDDNIAHFMEFITSPAIMTDSPFGESTFKLSSGKIIKAPKIILNSVRSRTVDLYMKYCEETEYQNILSERTYMRILETVEPKIRKSMKGLDNYAAEGAQAFDDLKACVSQIGQMGKGAQWVESTRRVLNDGKNYLKMEYKLHVACSSDIADHCCPHALSADEDSFSLPCSHNHTVSCEGCINLSNALRDIKVAAMETEYPDEDIKDDIQYKVNRGTKAITEWKKHILRTVNQDEARKIIIEGLKNDEAFLERDWAMKFLPLQYRESQSKWFAKRGLSWHIGVVTFKDGENENDDFQTITFVHVFDSTTQDAAISTAILSNTLENINILKPDVSKVYIRSDNAGCFHSSYGICSVPVINKKIKNLKVNRIDFSDPQGGKSICDRRAAHIKSHIRRYVNEGNNVVTATDFKQAIEETMPYVKVIIAAPPIGTSKVHTAKLEKITSLNNFQFHNNGITVWKQYRIGPGKFYSHRQLQIDFSKPLVNLTVISESKCVMKTKKERCQEMTAEKDTTPEDCVLQEPDVDLDTEPDSELSSNVFTCPEDGCISSFLKYGNLLNHLSCGKHTFHSGNLVMKDRVAMKYSSLMETKSVNAHVLRACPSASALDTLGKGWGFKEKKESKPFTPEQAQYLIQKFNVGERSGIKCDPEDVSREMRSIKDGDGKRIFTSKHFLSAIQVSSYFSRLSLKKRQSSNSSYSEIDLVAEEKASNIASLSSELK